MKKLGLFFLCTICILMCLMVPSLAAEKVLKSSAVKFESVNNVSIDVGDTLLVETKGLKLLRCSEIDVVSTSEDGDFFRITGLKKGFSQFQVLNKDGKKCTLAISIYENGNSTNSNPTKVGDSAIPYKQILAYSPDLRIEVETLNNAKVYRYFFKAKLYSNLGLQFKETSNEIRISVEDPSILSANIMTSSYVVSGTDERQLHIKGLKSGATYIVITEIDSTTKKAIGQDFAYIIINADEKDKNDDDKVGRLPISNEGVTLEDINFLYTGSAIKPSVKVVVNGKTLVQGKDYTVSYQDNVNVGTGTAIVDGVGGYIGVVTKSFTIARENATVPQVTDISKKAVISLTNTSFEYTGSSIQPLQKVVLDGKTLTKDKDYSVTYKNNTNVGTATVTVTGKGDYTGTVSATFVIVEKKEESNVPKTIDISGKAVIKLDSLEVVYTGSAIEPKVTVILDGSILERDKDYVVAYSNNKDIGKATITITGKGTYVGTVKTTFVIIANQEKPVQQQPVQDEPVQQQPAQQETELAITLNDNVEIKEAAPWKKADSWAEEELLRARDSGMIPKSIYNKDFTESITRKDFAAVAVTLYEKLTGKTARKAVSNPFSDTDDEYVLKAYDLGITLGTSDTTFTPNSKITREQMATMLTRAVDKADIYTKIDLNKVSKFSDNDDLHEWGRASVYFMSSKGIIKGIGNNMFNAVGNAKIEEALLIALRCYDYFTNK